MKSYLLLIILPMHLFLLYSIFDIYFTSPIVANLPIVEMSHHPLADRLVLYVIDGLRASKLYTNEMKETPFLKQIISDGNPWGLSNTRVPTETRPGHVALIAGFYEDVSSITKGWQENAVEFDSLFNRSSTTWSWGSPDVLPMFQKGAIKDKIHTFCYQSELEDFAGNQTWELDTWVFDQVKIFFSKAINDSELNKQLRRKGVVFFLHLLGIDVSGHSQKPNSDLYTKNLKIVSQGIENMTNLFNDYFGDNKTAFIVTSDHGMTDWGSHGAGSDDETSTPIIAWGSGIFNSKYSRKKINDFQPLSKLNINSNIYKSFQNDIMQADICALMASLLGIHIPINSVGVVPIDYINATDETKALILRTNIHQLFLQYEAKYNKKKHSSLFHFREYENLPMESVHKRLEECNQLITKGEFQTAIELYKNFTVSILDGITYFHRYDREWLGFLFALSFILWILLLATHIVQIPKVNESFCKTKHCTVLLLCLLMSSIYVLSEDQPYSYFLYQMVPIVLIWYLFVFKKQHLIRLCGLIKKNYLFFFGAVALIESIVWSFFYRKVLVFGLFIAFVIVFKTSFKSTGAKLKLKWTFFCIVLMFYPNFPVIAGYSSCIFVLLGGILNSCLSTKCLLLKDSDFLLTKNSKFLRITLIVLNFFTAFHVYYCQSNIQSGYGLLILSQFVNWSLFLFLIPIICCLKVQKEFRIRCLFAALAIMYNLMSIYYELIFLFSLIIFSLTWMEIETAYQSDNIMNSDIDKRNIVQTIIYVFLMTYSFFATGNIASLNSFDVVSTYCFLTIFKPFLMGFILIMKIIVPMITISLAYVYIQHKHNESIQSSNIGLTTSSSPLNIEQICLVTIISDFAALHFLFMIKDSGSWLEIGTSISHYVISMAISIGAFLFTLLAKHLMTINSDYYNVFNFKSK